MTAQIFASRTSINLSCAALCLIATLIAPSTFAAGDPWEKMNRGVFGFNDWADRSLLRPVAKGYVRITPSFVQQGVSNFFDNVGTPAVALNQLLQRKPRLALSDLGRFVVNTTVGIGGLFDVGSRVGLLEHDEDFGQTFAVWGVREGNYLVLPLLGSSSIRNATGRVFDWAVNPMRFLSDPEVYYAMALSTVDLRAELLSVDQLVTGDEYLFLRDTYQQRRQFLINDGVIEDDPFADDDFDEDF